MDNTYWHQQTKDKPLFDNVLWSKPEHRDMSGKLAIIGGSAHGFNSVSLAYGAGISAGIGIARAMMPDSLSKTVGKLWPESEFAPSSKSGGFSTKALSEWLAVASWADATFISGDLGKSSETAILLERFLEKESGNITLCGDSLAILVDSPTNLLNKEGLLLAPDFSLFQHLLTAIRYPTALKSTMTLFQVIDLLHSLTLNYPFDVCFIHDNQNLIASKGEVSSTPLNTDSIVKTAVSCAVWRLQQPGKPFEAMTSAVYSLLGK